MIPSAGRGTGGSRSRCGRDDVAVGPVDLADEPDVVINVKRAQQGRGLVGGGEAPMNPIRFNLYCTVAITLFGMADTAMLGRNIAGSGRVATHSLNDILGA